MTIRIGRKIYEVTKVGREYHAIRHYESERIKILAKLATKDEALAAVLRDVADEIKEP